MDGEIIDGLKKQLAELRRLGSSFMAAAVERRIREAEAAAASPPAEVLVETAAEAEAPAVPLLAGRPEWLTLNVSAAPRILFALGPVESMLYFHNVASAGRRPTLEPCFLDECRHCPGSRLFWGYFAAFEPRAKALRIAWVYDVDDVERVARGVELRYLKGRDKATRVSIGREPSAGVLPAAFDVRPILMRRYRFPYWPGERPASADGVLPLRRVGG